MLLDGSSLQISNIDSLCRYFLFLSAFYLFSFGRRARESFLMSEEALCPGVQDGGLLHAM